MSPQIGEHLRTVSLESGGCVGIFAVQSGEQWIRCEGPHLAAEGSILHTGIAAKCDTPNRNMRAIIDFKLHALGCVGSFFAVYMHICAGMGELGKCGLDCAGGEIERNRIFGFA